MKGRRPASARPSQRRSPSRGRRWLRRALRLLLVVVVLLALPVPLLRWFDPPGSAFMLARWLEERTAAQPQPLDWRWRDLDEIAPALALAVVAAEDQKFPHHHGFDTEAIRSVLQERRERPRGASTLSQQLAKNLFLWSGRSMLRKGLEAGYTALIEATWPKRRILEVYLNVAEFGDRIYGAEAAAQHYFGKPAAALTPDEAALLAAVLPNPRRYRADAPGPYLRGRQTWVRTQMGQLGAGYLQPCCAVGL